MLLNCFTKLLQRLLVDVSRNSQLEVPLKMQQAHNSKHSISSVQLTA
jgi:hypothetical protein